MIGTRNVNSYKGGSTVAQIM